MSRWICVDDICIPSDENDWEELVAFADAIAEQEPINIVRCKECIHNPWNEDYDYTCIWDDDFANRPQTPNDFCSYGERSRR